MYRKLYALGYMRIHASARLFAGCPFLHGLYYPYSLISAPRYPGRAEFEHQ